MKKKEDDVKHVYVCMVALERGGESHKGVWLFG